MSFTLMFAFPPVQHALLVFDELLRRGVRWG